jgi:hypothetical protein
MARPHAVLYSLVECTPCELASKIQRLTVLKSEWGLATNRTETLARSTFSISPGVRQRAAACSRMREGERGTPAYVTWFMYQ